MGINENNIVTFLVKGEEKAYKYLFDHHYAVLCHIAASIVRDNALAEDVVSDVFFNIYQKRSTLEIRTSLKNYLVTAVRNRALNVLIKTKRADNSNLEDPIPDPIPDPFAEPDNTIMANELRKILDTSIYELSPECRAVFEKSRNEGKSYQEIAYDLGISVNTVKYHIKNALAHIRKDVGKYMSSIILILTTLTN